MGEAVTPPGITEIERKKVDQISWRMRNKPGYRATPEELALLARYKECQEAAARELISAPPAAPSEPVLGLEDLDGVGTGMESADRKAAYFEKATASAIENLHEAGEGERNHTLNTVVFKLVGMGVGLGQDYSRGVELLKMAAIGIGLSKGEIEATVRSAIRGGKKAAFVPESLERPFDFGGTPDTVVEIEGLEEEPEQDLVSESNYPTYNLKDVLPDKNTFLDAFCAEGLKVALPEEFHLFVGLAALSVAVGRSAALKRIEIPTYPNLGICLTANSAAGKGRCMSLGTSVVEAALPFDDTPLSSMMDPEGVWVSHLPGSGEQLIKNLDVSSRNEDGKIVRVHTLVSLIQFDEMARFVSKSGGRGEENSYKSIIIEFADCKDRITTNAGGRSSTVADGFVSFLTSTQPGHLRSQFGQRDKAGGFLNRFIFPFGRSVKQPAFESVVVDKTLPVMLLRDTHNWVRSLSKTSDSGFTPSHWYRDEDWTAAAKETYGDFIDRVIDPECERNTEQADILGRMRVNVLRLILLFAVNLHSQTIEVEHVESALALYPYLKACALALTLEIKKTENSENLDLILNAVKKVEASTKPRPASKYDLNRASAEIKNMNLEDFTNAVNKLVQSGQIHRVTRGSESKGGKSSTCWSTMPLEHWKKQGAPVRSK